MCYTVVQRLVGTESLALAKILVYNKYQGRGFMTNKNCHKTEAQLSLWAVFICHKPKAKAFIVFRFNSEIIRVTVLCLFWLVFSGFETICTSAAPFSAPVFSSSCENGSVGIFFRAPLHCNWYTLYNAVRTICRTPPLHKIACAKKIKSVGIRPRCVRVNHTWRSG